MHAPSIPNASHLSPLPSVVAGDALAVVPSSSTGAEPALPPRSPIINSSIRKRPLSTYQLESRSRPPLLPPSTVTATHATPSRGSSHPSLPPSSSQQQEAAASHLPAAAAPLASDTGKPPVAVGRSTPPLGTRGQVPPPSGKTSPDDVTSELAPSPPPRTLSKNAEPMTKLVYWLKD